MLSRFICIWNSAFSGFWNFPDLDRRSFGMYRRMFRDTDAIPCGALVTCKPFRWEEDGHAPPSISGLPPITSYKSTLSVRILQAHTTPSPAFTMSSQSNIAPGGYFIQNAEYSSRYIGQPPGSAVKPRVRLRSWLLRNFI